MDRDCWNDAHRDDPEQVTVVDHLLEQERNGLPPDTALDQGCGFGTRTLMLADRHVSSEGDPRPQKGTSAHVASVRVRSPLSPALIVGLGNPGVEYASHRHNVGFRVVEALARQQGWSFSRRKKAKAHVAEGRMAGQMVLLAKPSTYMNLSGQAVGRLSRVHQVPPERILVVYDDLDLPVGRLRLRPEGGSGGHNGMRSIIQVLGVQSFPRLRVGIDRPPGSTDPADYVLQPFTREQKPLVSAAVERAVDAIECWLSDGILAAMDEFNRVVPLLEENGA